MGRRTKQGLVAAVSVVLGLIVFGLVERVSSPRFCLETALDRRIPFLPGTLPIYLSFFPFAVLASAIASRQRFITLQLAFWIALALALICFLLVPVSIPRPALDVIESPFLRQRFRRMWRLDAATNGFPSLHVAIAVIASTAWRGRRHRWLAGIVAFLICVATLTVKQHTLWDVVGGLATGVVALALARRWAPDDATTEGGMTELSLGRAAVALLLDWGLIALGFLAAIWAPGPLTYLAAAILIARTQLALAVMMHEGAHGLLCRNRELNDLVAQLFAAGPLVLSLDAYRAGHLKHHRAPMASDDPIVLVFGVGDYPLSRRRLVLRLLCDLTAISYVLGMIKLIAGAHRGVLTDDPRPRRAAAARGAGIAASIVATNGLLAGALAVSGHAWLYLGLWVLPALTLLQVLARVRGIMEHGGYPQTRDQSRNARTIARASWQTFFFGPHAVHFHIEHHLNVRVPFYRLKDFHRVMSAAGRLPAENLYRGYGPILKEVSSRA